MTGHRESSGALANVALAVGMIACCGLPVLLAAGIATSAIGLGVGSIALAAAGVALAVWGWRRHQTARRCRTDDSAHRTASPPAPTNGPATLGMNGNRDHTNQPRHQPAPVGAGRTRFALLLGTGIAAGLHNRQRAAATAAAAVLWSNGSRNPSPDYDPRQHLAFDRAGQVVRRNGTLTR